MTTTIRPDIYVAHHLDADTDTWTLLAGDSPAGWAVAGVIQARTAALLVEHDDTAEVDADRFGATTAAAHQLGEVPQPWTVETLTADGEPAGTVGWSPWPLTAADVTDWVEDTTVGDPVPLPEGCLPDVVDTGLDPADIELLREVIEVIEAAGG